jgi:hypothetical protein
VQHRGSSDRGISVQSSKRRRGVLTEDKRAKTGDVDGEKFLKELFPIHGTPVIKIDSVATAATAASPSPSTGESRLRFLGLGVGNRRLKVHRRVKRQGL